MTNKFSSLTDGLFLVQKAVSWKKIGIRQFHFECIFVYSV